MHVLGSMVLHQNGGWASGGWMSDSLVDGNVGAGPQQQWISRNSQWGSWTSSNWNMVFVGVPSAPQGEWPRPAYTRVAETPVIREKPFSWSTRSIAGAFAFPRWSTTRRESLALGETAGQSVPLSRFYIAHAGTDSAAALNAQLQAGKNLLSLPESTSSPSPFASPAPTPSSWTRLRHVEAHAGHAAMTTAMPMASSSPALLRRSPQVSPSLLEVGPAGSQASHAGNPRPSLHPIPDESSFAWAARV